MQPVKYITGYILKITCLLFLSCLFLCSGCSKNLNEEPYSFLEEENSFKTASDATVAINGVYSRLRTIYNTSYLILSDINTDEGTARSDAGASLLEIDRNSYTAANPLFDQLYTNSYLLIDRANRVIKNVPGINMDGTKSMQIVGEAKFLRALSYFNLVQAFGAVPLVLEPSSDVVNVSMPRQSVESLYVQIIQDLKDAESSNLPEQYTTVGEVGRATIGAVKSIMAKVFLTNKDYANAAAKAKEVIDAQTYSLFPDYKDIFPPENKNGMEHIFSVQYSCIKTDYASDMGLNFSIYFSWPIQQGGGSLQAEEPFADSYLSGDYRKTVTIITQKVNPANGALVESRTGSHQDKYWDASPCGATQARNNFMVIRYADVLLMYAEAVNELSGPNQEAYTAINEVRARARNSDAAANPQDLSGLTQDEFRDAVLQERSWELCFEGHRRWDLLRTGKYISVLQAAGLPVQERNILYPIPQNEIDVNSDLTQNTGY